MTNRVSKIGTTRKNQPKNRLFRFRQSDFFLPNFCKTLKNHQICHKKWTKKWNKLFALNPFLENSEIGISGTRIVTSSYTTYSLHYLPTFILEMIMHLLWFYNVFKFIVLYKHEFYISSTLRIYLSNFFIL